jgi:hypothetical protein
MDGLNRFEEETRIGLGGELDPFYQFEPVRSPLAQARREEAIAQELFKSNPVAQPEQRIPVVFCVNGSPVNGYVMGGFG